METTNEQLKMLVERILEENKHMSKTYDPSQQKLDKFLKSKKRKTAQ